MASGNDDSEEMVLEMDPKGRFQKTDQLLGQGAFKWVYKGYDTEEARVVAWNELKTTAVSKRDREKFKEEVSLLREFRHPNLLIFYDWWVADNETKVKCNGKKSVKFVFITELMTSGTLKQYVRKVNSIRPQAIQNWCRQILNGLNYLHKNNIIHRDLKCDNVFINGANNIIKIGDLGLATFKTASHAESVIGTPEFMAPEMYEEKYTEKVDIYAFGMCVMEMFALEYPYSECTNAAQIYKKVTSGVRPKALETIHQPQAQAMVENCISVNPVDRMTCDELLECEFLTMILTAEQSIERTSNVNNGSASASLNQPQSAGKFDKEEGIESDVVIVHEVNPHTIQMKFSASIRNAGNQPLEKKAVHFPFDVDVDTADNVANEMVESSILKKKDLERVVDGINRLVSEWKSQKNADAEQELSSVFQVDESVQHDDITQIVTDNRRKDSSSTDLGVSHVSINVFSTPNTTPDSMAEQYNTASPQPSATADGTSSNSVSPTESTTSANPNISSSATVRSTSPAAPQSQQQTQNQPQIVAGSRKSAGPQQAAPAQQTQNQPKVSPPVKDLKTVKDLKQVPDLTYTAQLPGGTPGPARLSNSQPSVGQQSQGRYPPKQILSRLPSVNEVSVLPTWQQHAEDAIDRLFEGIGCTGTEGDLTDLVWRQKRSVLELLRLQQDERRVLVSSRRGATTANNVATPVVLNQVGTGGSRRINNANNTSPLDSPKPSASKSPKLMPAPMSLTQSVQSTPVVASNISHGDVPLPSRQEQSVLKNLSAAPAPNIAAFMSEKMLQSITSLQDEGTMSKSKQKPMKAPFAKKQTLNELSISQRQSKVIGQPTSSQPRASASSPAPPNVPGTSLNTNSSGRVPSAATGQQSQQSGSVSSQQQSQSQSQGQLQKAQPQSQQNTVPQNPTAKPKSRQPSAPQVSSLPRKGSLAALQTSMPQQDLRNRPGTPVTPDGTMNSSPSAAVNNPALPPHQQQSSSTMPQQFQKRQPAIPQQQQSQPQPQP